MTKLTRMGRKALVLGLWIWGAMSGGLSEADAAAEVQEKIFPLPEVTSAYSVKAWGGRLFISDARSREILIYSLAEARFLGRIGKSGQGPGEFDSAPRVIPLAAGLAAKSFSKLLFFSSEGVFQREAKGFGIDLMASGFPIFPVEGGYIGFPFVRDENGRMEECIGRIYNADWKPVRDFGDRFPSPTPPPPPPPGSKQSGPKQESYLIHDCVDAAYAGGNLYLGDSRKGLVITVFDEGGEKIREIRVPLQPVEVSREEKEKLLAHWRERMKNALDLYHPVVPDVYPAFFAFRVDGEEIHAVAPARKDGRYEIITLDLKGNILRKGFLFPLEPSWGYPPRINGCFDILDGRLYSVDYNEEAERYELRITPLK